MKYQEEKLYYNNKNNLHTINLYDQKVIINISLNEKHNFIEIKITNRNNYNRKKL